MSIPSGKRISICDKEFSSYDDLARHMQYISKAHLKGTKEVSEEHLIKALKAFKKSLVFGEHAGAYEHLISVRFHTLCIDLMKLSVENHKIKLLSSLLSCIITLTDNSKAMCEMLVKGGLPGLIIDQSIQLCDRNFKEKLPKSVTVDSLMAQLILIVHNIAIDTRFQQSFIQNKNIKEFKESIIPYMKSKDKRMAILTMAALTWLIDDEESKTCLEFYCKIIENFVEFINSALHDEKRRCEGLRISEMLQVMRSLSNIKAIKNDMIRKKSVMSLIKKVHTSKSSSNEEIKIALSILYNLINDDDIKEMGTDEIEQIKDIARSTSQSDDAATKRVGDLLVLELKEKIEARKADIKYDIFISYCPEDKRKILDVEKCLKQKGYVIWFDGSGTMGHCDEHIRQVIQQSQIVIAGISNSFFNNEFCHSELKYAHWSKKPIVPITMEERYRAKDWLHEIIKKETCIDFTNDIGYDKLLTALSRYIESNGKSITCGISKKMESVKLGPPMQGYKDWTNVQVCAWLRENNLSSLQSNISNFDGKMLKYMKDMKDSSMIEYSRRVRDDLKLTLSEEIAFGTAIDNLNEA